jgi:hypothetical protein
MSRQSRVEKAKQMISEGKDDAAISRETGLYRSKIAALRNEPKAEQKTDIVMSDINLSLDSSDKAESIKMPERKASAQKQQVFDISAPAPTSSPTVSTASNSAELDKFRKYLAGNVARFESALFKALADEPMPKEERDMLEESWLGLFNIVIKDTNMELAICVMLLATAHGTIYLMHSEKLGAGIARIRNKRAESLGAVASSPPLSSSGSSGQPLPNPKPNTAPSTGNALLKGDKLQK